MNVMARTKSDESIKYVFRRGSKLALSKIRLPSSLWIEASVAVV
jgi:hypothetical protein